MVRGRQQIRLCTSSRYQGGSGRRSREFAAVIGELKAVAGGRTFTLTTPNLTSIPRINPSTASTPNPVRPQTRFFFTDSNRFKPSWNCCARPRPPPANSSTRARSPEPSVHILSGRHKCARSIHPWRDVEVPPETSVKTYEHNIAGFCQLANEHYLSCPQQMPITSGKGFEPDVSIRV